MELEYFMAVNYHVARGTLKVESGSFYDKWSFIWFDTLILATVSRFNNQVRLITSIHEELVSSVLEFIETERESISSHEDQENWN